MNNPLDILVVEDNAEYAANAKTQLAGHNVTFAKNYCDAMDLLKEKKFGVVLTDLHVPYGRIGPVSLDVLVSQDDAAKGVALSALRSTPELAPVYEMKRQDVLTKPECLGYAIALYAKMCAQVPDVAIVTDINHHSGVMAATIDEFMDFQYRSEPAAQYNGFILVGDSKDYAEALDNILRRSF